MTIRTVGLVGGGTMGQGIAITCAASGLDVLLREKAPALPAWSVEEIRHSLDRDIAK
jgi:3-hydroxybutyryl-CoA dehydrogenase